MKTYNYNQMYFNRFLVVTATGEVGTLLIKFLSDGEYKYIANIPNEETNNTCYDENEIDIVEKSIFENLNRKW